MHAIAFDVDGTLVDTTYLHVLAWSRVFAQIDEPVEMSRIHREIGKGGGELVESLLGRPVPELTDLHASVYRQLHPEIRAFPRAGELLRALAGRGVRVVLASSAEPAADEANRAALGAGDAIHGTVASEDVGRAKPAPDLFEEALAVAGAHPDDAICVGDSVWDVLAAEAAGLACIGVRCGGISEAELRDAGAVEVYADPAELLASLDRSPRLGALLGAAPRALG
jgi:HAD superfamily hydrolase (TIGR01509 family)